MKKYFLTGFITLLPLALTLMIAAWLFNLFTAPVAGLMETLILAYEKQRNLSVEHHTLLVTFLSRIFSFVALIVLIFLLGVCGQKFLVNFFLKAPRTLFARIPLVRTIFRLSHDITNAMFSNDAKTFKETTLIPFPYENALAIGFVMGPTPAAFRGEGIPPTDLAVFVPTAPHPMSGFVLLVPKGGVHPTSTSVEEGFKFLISCGVIHPGEKGTASEPSDSV